MSPNGHIIISNIPPFDSILKKESRDAIYQICILVLLHRPGPNGQTAFHTAVKSLFCRRTSERIPAPCSVQTGNHAKTGQKHTEPIYLCVCLKLQVFSTVLYDQPSEKGIYGLTATFLTGMTKDGGFFCVGKELKIYELITTSHIRRSRTFLCVREKCTEDMKKVSESFLFPTRSFLQITIMFPWTIS